MLCNAMNSCNGMHSCAGQKSQPDNSVGMDKKRKDLIANSKFRKVMAEYGTGKLKSSNGQAVNSAKQAEAIAASESGQSYNQQTRKESKYDRYGVRSKNG